MMSRTSAMVGAALMAMRRCEPLSRPLVYHVHSARDFVDHPAFAAARARVVHTGRAGSDVAEAVLFRPAIVEQQVDVVVQERGAFFGADHAHGPALEQVLGLRENPRVAQHAPAHEDATHALAQAFHHLLGLHAVAGAEHRNRDAARDLVHEVPVGRARVRLLGGAAVERDGRRTGLLDPLRHVGGVGLVVVPALAHLHRHRDADCLDHRADDAGGVFRFAHQAAAGMMLGDFRHRAAHVDVHDIGAHALDDARRLGHAIRIAAEDLDGHGPLFLGVLGVLERPVDAAHQPLAAHHLAYDQAAPAVPLHQPAEGRVGHAGHGRDDQRRGEFDGADLHGNPSILARMTPAARQPALPRPALRRPANDVRGECRRQRGAPLPAHDPSPRSANRVDVRSRPRTRRSRANRAA